MKAATPPNEELRLAALQRYKILDTPLEAAFDEITRLVAFICKTPIAVVNFVDAKRQWFKSEIGLGVRETPLDPSICAHAILQSDLFIIPDTTQDQRFANNPLVTGDPRLRFYAGALLKSDDGHALGTLCVLDIKPRELTPEQLDALQILAHQVMVLLNMRIMLSKEEETTAALRRSEERLATLNKELALDHHMIEDINRHLERRVTERTLELKKANDGIQIALSEKVALIQDIHHRVKNNLQIVTSLLRLQSHELADPAARAALKESQDRIHSMALVHELLFRSKDLRRIRLKEYLGVLGRNLFTANKHADQKTEFKVDVDDIYMDIDTAIPCGLIVTELVVNALKFTAAEQNQRAIEVSFHSADLEHCVLAVTNTGHNPQPGSVSFRIVQALAQQLRAEILPGETPATNGLFMLRFFAKNKIHPCADALPAQ